MAGSFPTLSFGTTVRYPLTLKVSCLTRVLKAANATEQRFAVRPAMVELDAVYSNLTAADQSSIDTFFNSQKGAFDSTWDITFDGKTFTDMRFLEDEIQWEEVRPNLWNTRLRSAGFHPAVSSPPSTLPALSTGAVTQLPWSKVRSFETAYTDMESGTRHATALRGGGLANFPTGAQRKWNVKWPAATAAEAEYLMKFFISVNGRMTGFSFTDPDTSVTYTGCRFDSDDLEVQYQEPAHCQVAFTIVKN
jgi:hypothetical protein